MENIIIAQQRLINAICALHPDEKEEELYLAMHNLNDLISKL
jgi:hypothetical protein